MRNLMIVTISMVVYLPAQAADIACSAMPTAAPDPGDPLCSVMTDRGLTGSVDSVLAALADESTESCKRDTMSGYEIRQAVDATEYSAVDPSLRSDFIALTSGGEALDPYGFGQTAIVEIFGSGPTLTALAAARVRAISINTLYGLTPRQIDVQLCKEGG